MWPCSPLRLSQAENGLLALKGGNGGRLLGGRHNTRMTRRITRFQPAKPPALDDLPMVHGAPEVDQWLSHYWHKLKLPADQLGYLAITNDRAEFALWTGRRLNPMALGCYCYLPLPTDGPAESGPVLNSLETGQLHRSIGNVANGTARLRARVDGGRRGVGSTWIP